MGVNKARLKVLKKIFSVNVFIRTERKHLMCFGECKFNFYLCTRRSTRGHYGLGKVGIWH